MFLFGYIVSILMQTKKVLYLITKSNWGGAQRYVHDLAVSLDRNLYTPIVAMGGAGTLKDMLEHAHIQTITLTKLKNGTGVKSTVSALKELVQIIKRERPDVLHLNSSVAGLIGALAGRLTGTQKIIFTAHGWSFNEDRPYWQRIIFKTLHWSTVMLCHQTIAVSRAIVEQMNWPLVAKKMTVINPGRTIGAMFSRDESREKIVDFFPRLSPVQKDPWLVCVAELHPIKRHQILFEAVRSLTAIKPNLRLICCGDGSERSKLETWIKNHGMQDHIFLIGNLHEAARFLKGFDAFVLASKSESYGYVIHEAGLAGLPIVATNVGGIKDIITSNDLGTLVEPDNVIELAAGIAEVLSTNNEHRTKRLQDSLAERNISSQTAITAALYN